MDASLHTSQEHARELVVTHWPGGGALCLQCVAAVLQEALLPIRRLTVLWCELPLALCVRRALVVARVRTCMSMARALAGRRTVRRRGMWRLSCSCSSRRSKPSLDRATFTRATVC